MAVCRTCGVTVTADSRFCPNCGSQIGGEATPGREPRRPSAESIATGEQRLLKTLREATRGEYEIVGEIGRGGMAIVFLANDLALNRRVAIKCMAPALMLMDAGIQERFMREARTAASLSHPHIIPVYAVKASRDLVFFVMKYIEGRSLESVLKEVGPLPIPVVQTILNQAGSALGYAHRKGVVHRDVKPGNIMLEEDGWVVMTDFGIAKVAEAEALTVTGGMVGTPAYMSPEQCQGGTITGAADQYSLGVVAYEMLTGRPPFQSGTMVNLIYDHCHSPPPPILTLRSDCPPELGEAVMRMLEKDPERRFPTIEDAVAAIGLVADTQEVARTQLLTLAQSTTTAKLLDKFRTPVSPTPPGRTASPAPATRGVPAPGAPTPTTPTPEPAPALAQTGARTGRFAWLLLGVPLVAVAAVALYVLGRSTDRSPPLEPAAGQPAAPVARLEVTPLALALRVGEETTLTAIARDASGRPIPAPIVWEALDDTVVMVSADGDVLARSPGQARVLARAGGSSATVVVSVTAPPAPSGPAAPPAGAAPAAQQPRPAVLTLAPQGLHLATGGTGQLRATFRDDRGAPMPGPTPTWRSSDPRIASVDAQGTVTAHLPGTVTVTATAGTQTATASVTVAEAAVSVVEIEPTTATLDVGGSRTFRAIPRDAQGVVLGDRTVLWRSSDPAVAWVSAQGQVNGVAPGTAAITATAEGIQASATVTVTARAPAAAPPTRDPRSEIAAVLEEYRRAIESRDLAELRRVYPALTSSQERAWRSFFESVSSLTARLDVQQLDVDADSARAHVSAVYEFRTNRPETQTTQVTITFRRANGAWRIVSVR